MTNLENMLKSRDITLQAKVCLVIALVFLVVVDGCYNWIMKLSTEKWMLLNCIVFTSPNMLEKTLEIPLDCKEIQPVSPKGHQSWGLFGRTDSEGKTPIL